MNAETKLLAGKALDKAVSYTWTKLDYDQILELLSCHAELVVRECMEVVSKKCASPTAYNALVEHFGVEE